MEQERPEIVSGGGFPSDVGPEVLKAFQGDPVPREGMGRGIFFPVQVGQELTDEEIASPLFQGG